MAHLTGKESCPNCRRHGNDRAGDNLCRYSDGSAYCFRCGHYIFPSGTAKLKESNSGVRGKSRQPTLSLPHDATTELPERAWRYLRKYSLTQVDVKKHLIMWSEYQKRLIFPYFVNGELIGYQGRWLGDGPTRKKWDTRGDFHDFDYYIGVKTAKNVVFVEDIVSAIKVAHLPNLCVCPLFGTHITTRRLLSVRKKYDKLFIWLDKDAANKAIKASMVANGLNLATQVIITEQDPKEIDDSGIRAIIRGENQAAAQSDDGA